MAARMRETEMQAALIEELKMRQLTGNMGPAEQPNPAPQNGPISTSTTRDGSSQSFSPEFAGLGNIGQTVGV